MVLDIIFLVLIGFFAFKGLKNGLVSEVVSLAGLVIGIYVAILFSSQVASLLGIKGAYAELISFGITFIATIILSSILGKMIEKLISLVALSFLNKLLGGVFGGLKVVLILSVLLFCINSLDKHGLVLNQTIRAGSRLLPPVEKVAPYIYTNILQASPILEFPSNEEE